MYYHEDQTIWWQFSNFACIDRAIIALGEAVFRELSLLTQMKLHVNSSSRLGNAFIIHQRPFEHMPVSLMGPHSEAIRINRKNSVNKALMPVQILFQCSSKKDLLMLMQSMLLDNFCAREHFSCERKCICSHSTTEKLACVLGFFGRC